MFSVKDLKAFSKKLSGKDSGKNVKGGDGVESGRRKARVGPDRVTELPDGIGPRLGPKVSTHRSGCSDDFKRFLSEDEEEVVAFESPLSGDFSINNSSAAWTKSSDWEPESKVSKKPTLQF